MQVNYGLIFFFGKKCCKSSKFQSALDWQSVLDKRKQFLAVWTELVKAMVVRQHELPIYKGKMMQNASHYMV